MITGLVFGKFMPVHAGHLALIDFARQQCDRLIVSMSIRPDDSIPPNLRLSWLRQLLAPFPTIEVVVEPDDFHDPALTVFNATKLWAAFIKRRFPAVSVFFASEEYGPPLAFHSGLRFIPFDPGRQCFPVSASQIRQNPAVYRSFIPSVVWPYFIKTICLFGPESTGKTTLSQQLASRYETVYVPEAARALITTNNFTTDDFIRIGQTQTEAVLAAQQQVDRILFCDTDVITTQIYATIYLQTVPSKLYELERLIQYDHYILLNIDVPWVRDGLRDQGDRREEMMARFRHELDRRQLPYTSISGSFTERFKACCQLVDQLLDNV